MLLIFILDIHTYCKIITMMKLTNIYTYSWGFPCGLEGKASVCNAGDQGSIPWSGKSPGPPGKSLNFYFESITLAIVWGSDYQGISTKGLILGSWCYLDYICSCGGGKNRID